MAQECTQAHKWNYHSYITDPADFEYAVTLSPQEAGGRPVVLRISKVGGGTPGEAYDGWWYYSYAMRDMRGHGDALHTGVPCTHEQAAAILAQTLADQLPDGSPAGERLLAFAGEVLQAAR